MPDQTITEKIYMETLVASLKNLDQLGFITQFKVVDEGLKSLLSLKVFQPEEVKIVHFYRFEGESSPSDSAILNAIETEITAKTGNEPGIIYEEITKKYGTPFYDRIEAKFTPVQKEKLKKLSSEQVTQKNLAGEKIKNILTSAPSNNAPIGGYKG